MNNLATLPNLEVLKLKKHAFRGPVWEQVYEGFTGLEFLLLESLKLVRWKANTTHFPKLKCLTVRYCRSLLEIPCGIAEIGTLQLIELVRCGRSVVSWAKEIQKYCWNMGIDDLYIRIEEFQEEQGSAGYQEERHSLWNLPPLELAGKRKLRRKLAMRSWFLRILRCFSNFAHPYIFLVSWLRTHSPYKHVLDWQPMLQRVGTPNPINRLHLPTTFTPQSCSKFWLQKLFFGCQ